MAFLNDLRIGARAWMRTPLASLTIVLTLGVGIGLNTAIFSLVHAALLQPLPYRDPAGLVSISGVNLATGDRDKVTGADLVDWRTRSRTVADFATYWDTALTLPGDVPDALPAWEVSPNLFPMLGTQALLGRTLVAEDGLPTRDRVIVLSHRLWLQRFGGDRDVVGRRIVLSRSDGVEPAEASYEIVGVMPATFAHPNPTAALWTALRADLSQNRRLPVFQVIGRLGAGASVERADEELKAIAATLASQFPQTNARRSATVRHIRSIYTGDVAVSLWVLQGAALVLLLIAGTNVTTLLLARAITRDKEFALRLAMGATRAQIFRQSAADAILLACSGTLLGVLLAFWGAGLLPRLLESQLAGVLLPESTALIATSDLAVVAALTLVIGLVLSFVPVLARRSPLTLIVDTPRTSTAPRGVLRVRAGFIVAQMASSLCLLIAAGLLVRSFVRLQDRPLGFRTGNVLSGSLILTTDRYRDLTQRELFLQELTTRLRALPNVEGAAAISTLPLSGADARRSYQIPGRSFPEVQWTQYRVVTPQYFDVMDIPVRRGRRFDERDRAGST